jgi:hypothetical protein
MTAAGRRGRRVVITGAAGALGGLTVVNDCPASAGLVDVLHEVGLVGRPGMALWRRSGLFP